MDLQLDQEDHPDTSLLDPVVSNNRRIRLHPVVNNPILKVLPYRNKIRKSSLLNHLNRTNPKFNLRVNHKANNRLLIQSRTKVQNA